MLEVRPIDSKLIERIQHALHREIALEGIRRVIL